MFTNYSNEDLNTIANKVLKNIDRIPEDLKNDIRTLAKSNLDTNKQKTFDLLKLEPFELGGSIEI